VKYGRIAATRSVPSWYDQLHLDPRDLLTRSLQQRLGQVVGAGDAVLLFLACHARCDHHDPIVVPLAYVNIHLSCGDGCQRFALLGDQFAIIQDDQHVAGTYPVARLNFHLQHRGDDLAGNVGLAPRFLGFNGDGVINITDLTQFRNRFGVILP
jgi:hypothetical protein